jgi:mono/diheme cytochrome c family protein
VLEAHCLRCHGGDKLKGKVDMRTFEALVKSGRGESKALVPGHPEQSTLYTSLVSTDPEEHMPPKKEKQVTAAQIESIRQWIAVGAHWPASFEFK